MARSKEKRGLGRGLSALMADIEPSASSRPEGERRSSAPNAERHLPIEDVSPNPEQPRRHFAQAALEELATSIREKGIIQPLIVRPNPGDPQKFQIVAGERRWRAAQLAQLHEVPVIIRDFDDTEVLEVAIIENIQRADLNPIEEAQGYRQLIERFGHTQEQLSQAMGKSRSHLANLMRLLQLPDEVQAMLVDGRLTAGHARALITADDPITLAKKAVAGGMSVRAVEAAAKSQPDRGAVRAPGSGEEKDADTRALESDLGAALGTKVTISHDAIKGNGKITINYKDLAALDDLVRILNSA